MLKLLRLIASLCSLATAAYAQPVQTYWPGRGEVDDGDGQAVQMRIVDCERPDNTVAAGDTMRFALDILGGFNVTTSLTNPDLQQFGSATIVNDSLLQYEAFIQTPVGGFDTITVSLCNADDSCRMQQFIIGAGRLGTRTFQSISLSGNEVAQLGFDVPPGDLFCGSITTIGNYEAPDRRDVRFLNYTVSDSLYYRSARVPGVDVLEIVTCNTFGTCDTLELTVAIATETVDLPFCDDFSYRRSRPDAQFWLQDDVYINDAYGINAPTYGVATFDGLTESGLPYGEGFGPTDELTSTYIDATGATDLHLSYFLQLGGRGQAPESSDGMLVEARGSDGMWRDVFEHQGSPTSTPDTTFQFFSFSLDSSIFKHEELQVRFRVTANLNGGFDLWNLDYVRVEEGDSGNTFADIALTAPPTSLLAPYTAVPYSQFEGREIELLRNDYRVGINNLFGFTNNVSDTRLEVFDANGDRLLDASLLTGAQFNLQPGRAIFRNPIPVGPLTAFETAVASASAGELRQLTTRYSLDIDTDQEQIRCVLRNDTASSITVIDDYYAYDDGTAESGLLPGGIGERIAVRYELFEQDTLRGLRYLFPRIGALDGDRQLINLQVYIGQLDDEPEYEEVLVRPYYPSVVRDTLNAFTTYGLFDEDGQPTELVIPAGEFFVGWQLASDVTNPIPVGLDLQNDNADQIFAEYGVGWTALPTVLPRTEGSLMIRPVFSAETLRNSSPTQESSVSALRLAPNPTPGVVTLLDLDVELYKGSYTLIDITGRTVARGLTQAQLDFGNIAAGLYVLRLHDSEGLVQAQSKILIE